MSKIKTLQQIESDLQDLLNIQCAEGNYDANKYMFGMANGLICAMSLFNNKDPEFMDEPAIFLDDIEILDKFSQSSVVLKND